MSNNIISYTYKGVVKKGLVKHTYADGDVIIVSPYHEWESELWDKGIIAGSIISRSQIINTGSDTIPVEIM